MLIAMLTLLDKPAEGRVDVVPPSHEPEPDGAIVRGAVEDYLRHHPGAAEVGCAIEVADSSLERDRGTKQRVYAAAGIPQYVILNLHEEQVEVYEEPDAGRERYARVRIHRRGEEISLRLPDGGHLAAAADRCLPPR